jgi:mannose-6-phosphate isomerase-like protein (cupin superfamily)
VSAAEASNGQFNWLIDGYLEWARREGVPIVEDVAVDLPAIPTGPWPRMGVDGALVHIHSRGDLVSLYVLDIPPGGSTSSIKHLYEAVYFVLDGQGSTVVKAPDGGQLSFEWGRASLFALPLNAPYQLYNSSGQSRARVAVIGNLPMVMKQFRDDAFVFENDRQFPERWGEERLYRGEGIFTPTFEMRHMWETNLVPDVLTFDRLVDSPNRGAKSSNIQFVMGESTMRTHISAVGVGDYKKAHIHGEGVHIIQLGDAGYSLYWLEGEAPRRVDWKFGMLHAPADQEWHQHFNVGDEPGRYMPVSDGNFRYPFTKANVRNVLHRYEVKSRIQIEYEDEDPMIRRLFEEERARWRAAHPAAQAPTA